MELDANVLTLLIIMAVVVWKARETLKDLKLRAAQQLRKPIFGPDPDGPTHAARDALDIADQAPATENVGEGADVARRLKDIRLADRSFDADRFLDRARIVYEVVIAAFADGDREILRDLLSADVYETFSQVIAAREERGEHLELTLVGLNRVAIVDANIFNGRMQITVGFESDLVTVTRDEARNVVAGNPAQIITAGDEWTFVKELTSRSPIWRLAATELPQDACPSSETFEAPTPENEPAA